VHGPFAGVDHVGAGGHRNRGQGGGGCLPADGVGAFATDLGVEIPRIKTIVFSPAATELGVEVAGSAALSDSEVPAVLSELADLLTSRAIELPIAATYPLDRVADAFEQLERRPTLGKIVLLP